MIFIFKISCFQILLATLVLLLPSAGNLEYEYAWMLSLLITASVSLASLLAPSRWWRTDFVTGWAKFAAVLASSFALLIPGSFLFFTSQCRCSQSGFYFWMFLLAFPSAWIGMGVLQFAADMNSRRVFRFQYLAAGLPLIGILVSLIWLWFFPQKRVTSIWLGFVHGPIYDRQIEVDSGVLLMRLGHGALGVLIFAAASRLVSIQSRKFLALVLFCVVAIFSAYFYPSQRHGLTALERALPKVIVQKDVELHYGPGKSGADETALALSKDASFHVSEIKQAMGLNEIAPIKIFAYSSQSQKKILFGGGQTDITDVWTPSVHIDLEASPHPTLRHELVHAVASYGSWYSIGFHPNMLLTEGLAMALAPVDYSISLDQMAAGLLKSGRIENLESLFNPLGFWSESGSRSYAVAGSILRWLSHRFGSQSIRAIYSGQSISAVVGKSLAEITDDWRDYVLEMYSSDADLLVEKISREPSVLADVCPHSVADLARKRSDGWLVRLRQPIGWDPELWLNWRSDLVPEDREARLDVMRKSIKNLLDAPQRDLTGLGVWVEALQKSRRWPPVVIEDVEGAILESDLEMTAGLFESADALLMQLSDYAQSKSLGGSVMRQINARAALADAKTALDNVAWRKYLAGWGAIPPASERSTWIEVYLRGRREVYPDRDLLLVWESRVTESEKFTEIRKEWQRMIAHGWARLEDYEKAARAYEKLSVLVTGDSKLLVEEHARRMRFLLAMQKPQ